MGLNDEAVGSYPGMKGGITRREDESSTSRDEPELSSPRPQPPSESQPGESQEQGTSEKKTSSKKTVIPLCELKWKQDLAENIRLCKVSIPILCPINCTEEHPYCSFSDEELYTYRCLKVAALKVPSDKDRSREYIPAIDQVYLDAAEPNCRFLFDLTLLRLATGQANVTKDFLLKSVDEKLSREALTVFRMWVTGMGVKLGTLDFSVLFELSGRAQEIFHELQPEVMEASFMKLTCNPFIPDQSLIAGCYMHTEPRAAMRRLFRDWTFMLEEQLDFTLESYTDDACDDLSDDLKAGWKDYLKERKQIKEQSKSTVVKLMWQRGVGKYLHDSSYPSKTEPEKRNSPFTDPDQANKKRCVGQQSSAAPVSLQVEITGSVPRVPLMVKVTVMRQAPETGQEVMTVAYDQLLRLKKTGDVLKRKKPGQPLDIKLRELTGPQLEALLAVLEDPDDKLEEPRHLEGLIQASVAANKLQDDNVYGKTFSKIRHVLQDGGITEAQFRRCYSAAMEQDVQPMPSLASGQLSSDASHDTPIYPGDFLEQMEATQPQARRQLCSYAKNTCMAEGIIGIENVLRFWEKGGKIDGLELDLRIADWRETQKGRKARN